MFPGHAGPEGVGGGEKCLLVESRKVGICAGHCLRAVVFSRALAGPGFFDFIFHITKLTNIMTNFVPVNKIFLYETAFSPFYHTIPCK